MKLFKMRTLGIFGIGFLAGSRAGNGPWQKAQQSMDQIKDKVAGGDSGSMSNSMSTNGFDSPKSQETPQLTEM